MLQKNAKILQSKHVNGRFPNAIPSPSLLTTVESRHHLSFIKKYFPVVNWIQIKIVLRLNVSHLAAVYVIRVRSYTKVSTTDQGSNIFIWLLIIFAPTHRCAMRIIKRLCIDNVKNELADDNNARISYVWRFCVLQRIGNYEFLIFPVSVRLPAQVSVKNLYGNCELVRANFLALQLSPTYAFSISSIVFVQRFRCKLAQINTKRN